jgi:hypothetical protein
MDKTAAWSVRYPDRVNGSVATRHEHRLAASAHVPTQKGRRPGTAAAGGARLAHDRRS